MEGESAAYQACHIILKFVTLMIRKCQDNQNTGEITAATVNEWSESTQIVRCYNIHTTIPTFKTLLSHSFFAYTLLEGSEDLGLISQLILRVSY